VSFTANVDPDAYQATDVAETLKRFAGLIKGSTIFPEASFEQAPYERITKQQYESAATKGVDEECANGACPIS
jgi:ribonucleoside-triphosphate reductase